MVEIMIVVVIIGLLAAMAIPAFNNLRQISSAAQQYMLDEGVSQVSTAMILGPGLHMTGLSSVADETYDFTVGTDTTRVTTTINGRTVAYDF